MQAKDKETALIAATDQGRFVEELGEKASGQRIDAILLIMEYLSAVNVRVQKPWQFI